jgi:hypothetical protein
MIEDSGAAPPAEIGAAPSNCRSTTPYSARLQPVQKQSQAKKSDGFIDKHHKIGFFYGQTSSAMIARIGLT